MYAIFSRFKPRAFTAPTLLMGYKVGDSLAAHTVVRGSSASYRTSAGLSDVVLANVARDNHHILNVETGEVERTLLLEGQRQNVLLRSREFDNAYWTKNGVTVVANEPVVDIKGVDPGAAESMAATLALEVHILERSLGVLSDNVDICSSIFYKAGTREFSRNFLRGKDSTLGYVGAGFGLLTGEIANVSPTITLARLIAFANGWLRASTVLNNGTGAAAARVRYGPVNMVDGAGTYLGQGLNVYIDGAQVEFGAFPTSFIETTTIASTRSGDSITFAGAWAPQQTTRYLRYYDLATNTFKQERDVAVRSAPEVFDTDGLRNRGYTDIAYFAGDVSLFSARRELGVRQTVNV